MVATLFLVACGEEKEVEKAETVDQVLKTDRVGDIDNLVVKSVLYKPGEHYTVLETPIESKDNEIIEYFWYKCSHCYKFEKMIKANYQELIKNEVTLRLEHAAISKKWVQDAQLFYTLREMKLEKKSTAILMEFFHNNKDGVKTFESVLAEIGTTQDELNKVYTSEPVIKSLKKSYEDAIKAGISGTPSIIVEGKYLMNNKAFSGYKEMLGAAIELTKIESAKEGIK